MRMATLLRRLLASLAERDARTLAIVQVNEVAAHSMCSTPAELIVRCSFEDTAEGGYHLSLTDVTLSVGESFNLRLLDENDERVEGASYSVKDTTVCTADGSKITGKASGVTRVTVTYYGESFECIIRVK